MAHDNHDHGYEIDRVPPDLLNQMGYETRDVGPKAILIWMGGLFVFIGIVTFGTLVLMDNFIPETGRVAYESEIFRTTPIRNNPPQPQLQTLPRRDMIMYRRDERRILDGYSATSEGRVSVPISETIDAIAAEGISGVKGGTTPQPDGDAYPGSGKYNRAEPNTAEAPETNDGNESQTATPNSGRATDSLTEERKNVPNQSHEQGGHGTEN
jgi:hypothetical protein